MAEQAADLGDEDLSGTVRDRSTSDLVEGFSNLNLVRQGGLMVGLAASVAFGVAIVLWMQGDDYRPLLMNSEGLDAGAVSAVLETHDITYKIEPRTGVLLVADEDIYRARLKLAAAGLPGDKSHGFELLEKEQPLGTSQFMETARYRRSLEGELARTITSINTVRSARVHLAIPRRSVFVRDQREPSASIFVDLYPGMRISPAQVKAMANLVSASIPELKLGNVSIVDQKGNLLTHDDTNIELIEANKQRDYTLKIERDVNQRIVSILEPVLGAGRYKAEVSADVDFTEVEQADEIFNPDMPAIRSEQTLDERKVGSSVAGIPGALTNQPPGQNADAPEEVDPETGLPINKKPETARKQATRNYELDRTVSYTKHQVGKVRRLSVAVVIDDKRIIDPETGKQTRVPWSNNELDRISSLVRDAVGYSAARGDSVNVINSEFMAQEEDIIEVPFYEHPLFESLGKPLGGVLALLVLILVLVRPVMKSLTGEGQRSKEDEDQKELDALQSSGPEFDALSDETVTLTGGDALLLGAPEESYEEQLNAIRGLIADDAGRVALVIKRWVNESE